MSLTTTLPAPPAGVENYVCAYMPHIDTYRIGSTDYSGDIYLSDSTLVDSSGNMIVFAERYEFIDGEWVLYGNNEGWTHWADSVENCVEWDYKIPVFSNLNVYSSGKLLSAAVGDDVATNGITLVSSSLSSSTMKSGVLTPILALVGSIVAVIVAAVGVRKGFAFIKSKLKGA